MSRAEELARLSEMAVNGRIVHKIDLIGMVKINGRHYFNVYRRYNSVYEIVVEDSNGDFYVQKDSMMRQSIGAVLCLSQEQLHSMYTTEIFSFRHGGTPPDGSRVPENMCWSDVQEEWYAVEIHLRGIWEDPVEGEVEEEEEDDEDEEDEDQEEEEDEDEYADMPPLISDDEEEDEEDEEAKEDIDAVCPYACDGLVAPSMTQPLSMKRTFLAYCCCAKKESSDDEDSDAEFYSKKRTFLNYWGGVKQESSEEENSYEQDNDDNEDTETADEEESVGRGCGPDDFIILRNGTKYRKVR